MKRNTPLLDLFCPGYFSTTQTAGYFNLDAFSSHAQRRSNGHLNSTLVIDTVLNLAGNSIAHDICIQLRTTDLQNVDLNIFLAGEFLQLFFNTVNFAASFTNDDTGLRGMNGNDQLIKRTLYHYLGYTTLVDTGVQVSSDLGIFDQLGSEIFFVSVPVAFPATDDP